MEDEEKGSLLFSGRNLATLSPELTWKIKDVPNELKNLVQSCSTRSGKGQIVHSLCVWAIPSCCNYSTLS